MQMTTLEAPAEPSVPAAEPLGSAVHSITESLVSVIDSIQFKDTHDAEFPKRGEAGARRDTTISDDANDGNDDAAAAAADDDDDEEEEDEYDDEYDDDDFGCVDL